MSDLLDREQAPDHLSDGLNPAAKHESDRLEKDFQSPAIADEDRNTSPNSGGLYRDEGNRSSRKDRSSGNNQLSVSNPFKPDKNSLFNAEADGGKTGAGGQLLGMKLSRRKSIAGGIIALGLGGVLFTGTIATGPLKFIHAAQLLQHFHFQSNEDLGDSRSSKVLLYALAGLGAENTRLGFTANRVANAWEKQLLEKNGVRPVYSKTTRYGRGYEIVNETKARESMPDLFDDPDFQTTTAGELKGQKLTTGGSGKALSGDTKVIVPKSDKALDPKAMRKLT